MEEEEKVEGKRDKHNILERRWNRKNRRGTVREYKERRNNWMNEDLIRGKKENRFKKKLKDFEFIYLSATKERRRGKAKEGKVLQK